MSRRLSVVLYIGIAAVVFVAVRAASVPRPVQPDQGESYAEECQSEGCDGEEVNELYATYQEECLNEGCDIEEVAETAGGHNSVNAMLDEFQRRGLRISACTFNPLRPPPGLNNAATGDATFIGSWCNQPKVDDMWHDFDFDRENWDDGFGYHDACNLNLPLARTFNALSLLSLFGQSKPERSSDWLPWFYAYASNEIDELDGLCGTGDVNGKRATTDWGPIIDNKTELYWAFFYGLDVGSRASTIVHEARHASWKGHDGDSCPRNASCDESWHTWGANTYQVMYLWWLRARGSAATSTFTGLVQARANGILSSAFDQRPTNGDVFGAGTPAAGSPFAIP